MSTAPSGSATGDGAPSAAAPVGNVVVLPGGTAVGFDYLNLHERTNEFTTSVLYDRGGTGWSEPVDLPRTCTEVVRELRDLLRVAHSWMHIEAADAVSQGIRDMISSVRS